METRIEVPRLVNVVAFCAIAREGEFFSGVRSAGVSIAAVRAWRDHHRYEPPDITELIEMQRQHGAEAFLTTEKDLVRLSPEQRKMLESAAPLNAATLVVRFRDESAALEQLCAFLPAHWMDRVGRMQRTP